MDLIENGELNKRLIELLAKALFISYCDGKKYHLMYSKYYGHIVFDYRVSREYDDPIAYFDEAAAGYFRGRRDYRSDKEWFRRFCKEVEESIGFITSDCPRIYPDIVACANRFDLVFKR